MLRQSKTHILTRDDKPIGPGSIVDVRVTDEVRKWNFPQERFFEWEQKDESFCRRYDIGKEVVVSTTSYWPSIGIHNVKLECSADGIVVEKIELCTQGKHNLTI